MHRDAHDGRPISRRRALAAIGAVVSGVAGTGVYGHWIEPERIIVRRVPVSLTDWPADMPGLVIGHLSDLHCDSESALDRTHRAVRLLMAQSPRVVFLTGDFVTSHGEQWAPRCADALAPLASVPCGAYAVRGNHDWWTGSAEIVERELTRVGITFLSNSASRLRPLGNVWVAGVESLTTKRESDEAALAGVPEDAVRFLLVHEPDFADAVTQRVSLQLSGHSHGGQIRLFGRALHTPAGARKYISGVYHTDRHPLYVTNGVGMIGIPMRLGCPPEVSCVIVTHGRRGGQSGTTAQRAAYRNASRRS
jgi:predicted MPP superfamily phosphohydrolase